ncbi:peptidase S8/S53 domain-containing protein [Daldinia decipiens]|uniref:peptidase S8/S53 domain-containing protein n=1 Tax=Daldinia decipiens TaxID=326647 RepID=UPI0020C1CD3A|nr:peptidase S8/S53 domain-containing protein [Daldinia decipiens]KAI1655013.1 peptidase S8/S53 domain-containing protein [Daldinia decipiens]
MKALPEVANMWPVQLLPRPSAAIDVASAKGLGSLSEATAGHVAKRQNSSSGLDYNTPHAMTGVDRLHSAGIKGKGIKIGILDTGVDYHHPALGGCFGPGCKISFGYDLVGENYTGSNTPVPDDDPLATCATGGHGTHVSGIIGMEVPDDYPRFNGLVGVAPEATIGMYRVFGCTGGVGSDVLVAGMVRAANDGVDVISISIGGFSPVGNSPRDPYHTLIQSLTDRGIAVVVAAGNDGATSPFSIEAPGNSPAAIAVGSVENTHFQVFDLVDSNGEVIHYGSVFPFPLNKTLRAILVGDGSEQGDFGCRALDFDAIQGNVTGSKDDYVVIVKRGLCGFAMIQTNAANTGFRNVLTYPDTEVLGNPFLLGYAATTPATDGNGMPLNLGTTTSDKIYVGAKNSTDYTVKFSDATPSLVTQTWGGQMNNFSSAGPVWDFSFKPQIAAPGGQILSSWPLSAQGWAIVSGTSMATPYLAGCYALVKSQLPELSVTEILTRLQTTAKPLTRATRSDLSPTVHQGAGLVEAYDAIFFQSFASPGQFQLGPNEILAKSQPYVTISNPSSKDVEYTLTHSSTPGMAHFPYPDVPNNQGFYNLAYQRLDSLPFAAAVEFPGGSTVTVPAGGSRKVPLNIQPPQDLNPLTIPIYTGFISVSSTQNEQFSIPYMGVGYNYSAAPTLGTVPVPRNINDFANYSALGAPQVFDNTSNGIGNYIRTDPRSLGILYSTLQPVYMSRMDLVRAEIDFKPTYYGFDPSVPVNYTKTATPTNSTIAGVEILGNIVIDLANAPYLSLIESWPDPPLYDADTSLYSIPMLKGGYRLLIQQLRYGGDFDKREDWTSWLSGVIDVPTDIA